MSQEAPAEGQRDRAISQASGVVAARRDHSNPANTIFIVARNNLHLTRKTVQSAQAQDIPCRVVVVDNASSDGTNKWLAANKIDCFSYPQQVSLATCWNDALRLAWSLGRTHAMLVNNDTEMRLDAYRLLLSHGGRFVSCVSVDSPDRMQVHEDGECAYLRIKPCNSRPHPDFSCFLIHKEVTDRTGWFDEDYYPAFCEDCQFHVRMHRAGIKAVCVDVPFLHHGSATIKHSDPAERKIIERGAAANRERFRKTYGCYPGTPSYEALFA